MDNISEIQIFLNIVFMIVFGNIGIDTFIEDSQLIWILKIAARDSFSQMGVFFEGSLIIWTGVYCIRSNIPGIKQRCVTNHFFTKSVI